MGEMLYVLLSTFFFAAANFHLGISHFLTTAIKFSCFSSNKIDLFCFLSLSVDLSLFSTSMKTLELSRKKESSLLLLLLLFISKSPGGYAIYCWNARVLEMQNFTPAYMKGTRTCGRTDDFLKPGFHQRISTSTCVSKWKLDRRKHKHKHKKNGQVRSSCACAYVVALISENGVDISSSTSTRPWINHRSLWPRENDLRQRIPNTWPSFHENYFQSILGSVSYCVVILRMPPYWSVRVASCDLNLAGNSFHCRSRTASDMTCKLDITFVDESKDLYVE